MLTFPYYQNKGANRYIMQALTGLFVCAGDWNYNDSRNYEGKLYLEW